jgi:hypothetical protein
VVPFQVECRETEQSRDGTMPVLRPILAGCLLVVLGSIASSQSGMPDEALSPAELLSPPPKLPQASGSGAKKDENTDSAQNSDAAASGGRSADYLAQCLRDWDAGTHMTRQQWARTCRRVANNRVKYLSEQQHK